MKTRRSGSWGHSVVRRQPCSIRAAEPIRATIEALESRVLLSGGYTYIQLGSFAASGTNPSSPAAQIARDLSGDIYGIANAGGANGTGAIFEVQRGNTAPVVLASFPATTAGSAALNPSGLVLDSSGNLFGVTESGGDTNGDGTIFELIKGSTSIEILANFNSATTGSSPGGNLLIDSSGDLFGLTATGGSGGSGTAWELPAGTTTITTLAFIAPVTINGVAEQAGIGGIGMDSSGNLFGTTRGNAAMGVNGTIWELPVGSGAIQTLVTFPGEFTGATPVGAIAVTNNDNLYGVTSDGGAGFGTVWSVAAGGPIVTLGALGSTPAAGVVRDPNGNLFGTASTGGGVNNTDDGVVWEIPNQSDSINVIQTFTGTDGATPRGELLTDRFGNVYGTTTAGGANGGGTVFELDLGGATNSSSDLASRVVKANLPAQIVVGQSAHGSVTVDITDTAKTPVRGLFTINLYASPDGAVDQSASRIGSVSKPLNIAAGKGVALAVPVPSFRIAAGTYTVLAQVADGAGDVSATTGGPSIVVGAAFISLTETIARLTFPTPVVAGENVVAAATLTITNGGNVPSVGPVTVVLYLSPDGTVAGGTQIATLTHRLTIPRQHSTKLTVHITTVPAGLSGGFFVVAQVTDPQKALSTAVSNTEITITLPQ